MPPLLAPSRLGPLIATAQAQQDKQSTGGPRGLGSAQKARHMPGPHVSRGKHTLLELERQVSGQESHLAAHSPRFHTTDPVASICLLILYLGSTPKGGRQWAHSLVPSAVMCQSQFLHLFPNSAFRDFNYLALAILGEFTPQESANTTNQGVPLFTCREPLVNHLKCA